MRMFAIGGRTFTKRVAQEFQVSQLEAERLKLEYAAGKLDARSVRMMQKHLTPDVEVWLSGVQLALAEIAEDAELPPLIYLSGGGARLPELKAALQSAPWTRDLPFGRRPTVRFLVPDDFTHFADETRTLTGIQDVTPLALAHLGLELGGSESVVDVLLRKAVKLLQN